MSTKDIAKYEAIYKGILAEGKLEASIPISEKTGKPKKNWAHRLLERLEKFYIECFHSCMISVFPLTIT